MSWRSTCCARCFGSYKNLKIRELVGIYTIKGEIVGLAEAAMSIEDIKESVKGIALFT